MISARELEVFALYSKGFQAKEIAITCGITVQTVRNHIRSVYSKLGATNCREAAFRLGWMRPHAPRSSAEACGSVSIEGTSC